MSQEMERVEFTREMKNDYTILVPNMLPVHFGFLLKVFEEYGYKLEILQNGGQAVVDAGLKYVHNDTCYPALLVIGQFMDALQSGKYDLHKTALLITQTGGGCRASNYIHLLRKALKKAGLDYMPVISLNLSGLEKNSGFQLTLPLLRKALAVLAYGDLLVLLHNQTMPYETVPGSSQKLLDRWVDRLTKQLSAGKGLNLKEVRENLNAISDEYAALPITPRYVTKVGVVGEIYVKYSPLGNNNLEAFLHGQDCEVMVPGVIGFMLFKVDNRLEDIKLYGGSRAKYTVIDLLMQYLTRIEAAVIEAAKRHSRFVAPSAYQKVKKMVEPMIGYGCKMGEGWLLTAEMVELVESGYQNIVCAQPFGCLPNHIVGKGMIRKIKSLYPQANIVPIDYDPGATRVNQENRIKLMLAVARENLPEQEKTKEPAAVTNV
ncbi:MAG TPA: 2-hydroxyglutaryl-CoA dehydratase [Ruminococcaceae bacterium]|nr:2-hydroxyglutaryl-CoA dehydratase [Oscillospiraceae bacterium]